MSQLLPLEEAQEQAEPGPEHRDQRKTDEAGEAGDGVAEPFDGDGGAGEHGAERSSPRRCSGDQGPSSS